MTVRTSVLWKMIIHMAKKWPRIVVHRLFIKEHSFIQTLNTSEIFSSNCVSWLPQLSISSRVFVTVVAVVLELLFFLWLSLSPLARHQDFSQCSKRLHMISSRISKKNVSYLKVKWHRTLDCVMKYLLY